MRSRRPHFFQPILHGFEHQLPIPVAFLKYLDGQDCKRAVLRGRGGRLWQVKIVDGRFLGNGWGEFARDHDLHVGEFLVFAHEGDMVFDVVVFDLSTCAREYPVDDVFKEVKVKQEEDDPDEELALVHSPGESSKEKEITNHKDGMELTSQVFDLTSHKQTVAASKGKARSSALNKKLFSIKITPGCSKYTMELPMKFTKLNHLREKPGNVDLIDQQGRSFAVRLACKKYSNNVYFGSGWKDFCLANGLKKGHTITFELVEKTKKMTFIMRGESSKENAGESSKEKEITNHKKGKELTSEVHDHKQTVSASKGKDSSSVLDKKLLAIKITPGCFKYAVELPMKFTRLNHLREKPGNVDLMDQRGRSFTIRLGCKRSSDKVYFGSGWKDFCLANGLKIGHTITFELIEKRKMTFIMRGLQSKPGGPKEKLNPPVVQIASSPIKPPHFTVALKAWHVRNCLNIPMDFAVRNGLAYRGCKMILKNGIGRSWKVQLTNDTRPASIGYGWTKVVRENELKLGDVVSFKLLRGGRWPVMKFKGTPIRKKVQLLQSKK